ncbi:MULTISPECIES: protein kinase domain-containing protein [Streptomyces]|uniref:protein kinase domain-containing protein n=1 Tax=Streptomyces scabiei TaxID=1930 RepID=UPI0004E6CD3F|nr:MULTISPECIES: protein kinase [Streptomyces]MBP5862547.1 serine/threonine protein kinase [Streptomyces sp. LBUM 1484]MBP5868503.1 serine/threonine protein kinase [Streptomyces sp. LBUM 1485]KFG07214.1 serine/threonine protein kinase [Streptomyces scabiei]MBP5877041.1 serine/threonine protein kinase [Streptomyces sp. LBUM 1477]MBP5884823.1 serine/threonine protein kinase [Streptomyces sp. LBUM 1487]
MAQQQRSQGPSDPEAAGGGMSDAPELWGNGGLVGDGRYRMTHRLGRGGMAEVFAAEDVRLGRTVAVKLLRSDLAEDPISKARFTREAQAVAGLNHHSIVAVYDSGEDVVNGTPVPYIVMELVEGRTIRDLLINAEAPGPEQALIIVSGVLEALAYSHQHGIVHRDIKPANVIITDNGAVKVMDFGIARALHGASTTMTQTGMVMGTPQYLSPEQALGKAVDHRSDLYATGCLLYELLALRPPFIGETPLSVVYQHVQDIPVPPSESSDGAAPPELDGLVMRSLAKEPDDRFQTAEEMRGLVQYGLQMLYDQGGHTGTWNTGPVAMHDGRHTPPGGMSGTTVMPHPGDGTSQIPQPILPGYGGGRDDGGFEGRGNRGSGRGKLWILAVLAVIAISAGVALALNTKDNGNGSGGPGTSKSPTATSSSKDKDTKETPTDEVTEEETQDNTGSGDNPDYTPSYTRSPSFSQSPTDEPTDEPTSEEPTASEEPTTSEEPEPPVTESPDEGSSGDTAGLPGGIGDDEG